MSLKINFTADNPGEFFYEDTKGESGTIKNVISIQQDPATIQISCYIASVGHFSHVFYKHELDFWRIQ